MRKLPSAAALVNFTRRDQMLYNVTLNLRQETTPDQLRYVMVEIRKMLIRHQRVLPEPARVRFTGFGESSLDVEIFAYIGMSNYDAYLGVREDVNLRIIEIVAASGTGFAYPSRTVYIARDPGMDPERGQHAAPADGAVAVVPRAGPRGWRRPGTAVHARRRRGRRRTGTGGGADRRGGRRGGHAAVDPPQPGHELLARAAFHGDPLDDRLLIHQAKLM